MPLTEPTFNGIKVAVAAAAAAAVEVFPFFCLKSLNHVTATIIYTSNQKCPERLNYANTHAKEAHVHRLYKSYDGTLIKDKLQGTYSCKANRIQI